MTVDSPELFRYISLWETWKARLLSSVTSISRGQAINITNYMNGLDFYLGPGDSMAPVSENRSGAGTPTVSMDNVTVV